MRMLSENPHRKGWLYTYSALDFIFIWRGLSLPSRNSRATLEAGVKLRMSILSEESPPLLHRCSTVSLSKSGPCITSRWVRWQQYWAAIFFWENRFLRHGIIVLRKKGLAYQLPWGQIQISLVLQQSSWEALARHVLAGVGSCRWRCLHWGCWEEEGTGGSGYSGSLGPGTRGPHSWEETHHCCRLRLEGWDNGRSTARIPYNS